MRAAIIAFLCIFSGHAQVASLSDAQLENLAKQEPKTYLPALADRLDVVMNRILEQTLKNSSPELRKAIMDSQKAWLAFRDSDSKVEAIENSGGSGASIYISQRRIYQTQLRIYQLQTPFMQGWIAIPHLKTEQDAAANP